MARIHAIPGCSWYTEKHVADRASAKRNRESALVKRDKELAHVYEIRT